MYEFNEGSVYITQHWTLEITHHFWIPSHVGIKGNDMAD